MKSTKYVAGALLLATVAGAAAVASAVPAQYADGVVSAVNYDGRTLTLGNNTYRVRAAGELTEVNAGDQVDVAYITEGGQRIAIAITLRPQS